MLLVQTGCLEAVITQNTKTILPSSRRFHHLHDDDHQVVGRVGPQQQQLGCRPACVLRPVACVRAQGGRQRLTRCACVCVFFGRWLPARFFFVAWGRGACVPCPCIGRASVSPFPPEPHTCRCSNVGWPRQRSSDAGWPRRAARPASQRVSLLNVLLLRLVLLCTI